ncbi:MAG: hypothetical protein OXG60_08695 [Chloroflexi bacterium]|nr:hypothetical protein [Chloroflexota bacterium]
MTPKDRISCLTRAYARGWAGLLLLALLLAPVAVQAQSARLRIWAERGNTVTVQVSFTEHVKSFSVHWGDEAHSNSGPSSEKYYKNVTHTYADCGKKSISADVAFQNGHMAHTSISHTIDCDPPPNHPSAQPVEHEGGQTCDQQVHGGQFTCRPSPPWFIDNLKVLERYIAEIGRRQAQARARGQSPYDIAYPDLRSFGYRCPDIQGYCDKTWVPSPSSSQGGTSGLSSPEKLARSDAITRPHTGVNRINAAGIGVKWIIDENPIDAVDIWGPGADEGGEVCFHGTEGRLVYLDARTSPRAQSFLSTYLVGDTICGRMPGPGSVVYLPPAG